MKNGNKNNNNNIFWRRGKRERERETFRQAFFPLKKFFCGSFVQRALQLCQGKSLRNLRMKFPAWSKEWGGGGQREREREGRIIYYYIVKKSIQQRRDVSGNVLSSRLKNNGGQESGGAGEKAV